MRTALHRVIGPIMLVVLAACASSSGPDADVTSSAKQANTAIDFVYGARAGEHWEHEWNEADEGSYAKMDGFLSEMDKAGARRGFYWDLQNMASHVEVPGDRESTETVDLFYVQTHGGAGPAWGNKSVWSAFEDYNHPNGLPKANAESPNIRLGDDGRGLSIFASYACDTHRIDDLTPTRLGPMMSGGLRITLGMNGPGKMGANGTAQEFGRLLSSGVTVVDAWLNGMKYGGIANTPAAVISGRNAADSDARAHGMTMATIRNYERLRDGDIGHYRYFWRD